MGLKYLEAGSGVLTVISGTVMGSGLSQLLLPDNWIAHVVSGAIGAFLALSIVSPETIKESVFRLMTGMLLAFIFTNPIIEYFDWLPEADIHLTAGAVIGAVSWFFLGALKIPFLLLREEGLIAFTVRVFDLIRGDRNG